MLATKRWVVLAAVLLAAGGIAAALWSNRSNRPRQAQPTAPATRGTVILTVGGVGRIVEARSTGPISVPSAASASATSAAPPAPTTTSADAVFPSTAGRVARFLVAPGDRVSAGEPIALLDDGSASAIALAQARNDEATAKLELLQKQTSDPTRGLPPSPAEIHAARAALTAARGRARVVSHPATVDVMSARLDMRKAAADLASLRRSPDPSALIAARIAVDIARYKVAQVSGPATPIDIASAQVELAKAQADLDALKASPPGPSSLAMEAAQLAVTLAQQRIAELPPGSPASDVIAAQLELKKAQAELEALQRPAPPVSPSAIAAAQAAIDLAGQKLALVTGPASQVSIASAQLDLQKAKSELDTLLRAAPPQSVAAARLAIHLAHERLMQLLHPTRAARDAATADVGKAVADLEVLLKRGAPAGPIDVAIARLRVQAADARIAALRLQADRLTVRAPFAGTVAALLTAQGAPADPSTPIATIADLRNLAVSVDLSEFDVAKVHRGDPALLAVDALGGRRLPGRVSFVALVGVDNGGVVNFPVRVSLIRNGAVRPGMNVSVRIIVAERRHVIRVPLEAVRGDTVTVVGTDGVTARRHVVLGLADNKQVEIRSGLRAGERVLLAPHGG